MLDDIENCKTIIFGDSPIFLTGSKSISKIKTFFLMIPSFEKKYLLKFIYFNKIRCKSWKLLESQYENMTLVYYVLIFPSFFHLVSNRIISLIEFDFSASFPIFNNYWFFFSSSCMRRILLVYTRHRKSAYIANNNYSLEVIGSFPQFQHFGIFCIWHSFRTKMYDLFLMRMRVLKSLPRNINLPWAVSFLCWQWTK